MRKSDLAKFMVILVGVSAVALLAYNYCIPTTKAAALDDSKATTEGVEEVAGSNNRFALDLYKNLSTSDKNVFISPWSISTALSMTYEGARGKTAEEMQSVLHIPEGDMVRRSSFARLYNLMNINKKYELSLANALWAQKDFQFLESYIDVNKNYYGARIENLDFENPSKAANEINGWVKDNTGGKIEKLVNRRMLPRIRLVLTNAIYFKGKWTEQFDKSKKSEEEFKVSPGKSVKVPMMRHSEIKDFNYTETEDLKVLKLPYKGKDLSMVILLPKEDFGLSEIEKNLTAEKFDDIEDGFSTQEVNVIMPKFEFKTDYDLKNVLKEMDMVRPFSPQNADFSGMTGKRNLFISFVEHKAYIKVDEEGTEAAGATAVGMELTSAEPPSYKTFRADHPFMFMIKDERTDAILFMGRVVNPKG